MKLFLQKKCKIFERWGLRPHTPVPPAAGGFAPKPPASGGWGLRPQTPIGLRRLGAPPPDPQNSPPPLRISGYAPVSTYYLLSYKMVGLVLYGISVACNFLKTMTTDKFYQRIDLYVNLHTEFNLARYRTTLFVDLWFRKSRTTYDKTRLY